MGLTVTRAGVECVTEDLGTYSFQAGLGSLYTNSLGVEATARDPNFIAQGTVGALFTRKLGAETVARDPNFTEFPFLGLKVERLGVEVACRGIPWNTFFIVQGVYTDRDIPANKEVYCYISGTGIKVDYSDYMELGFFTYAFKRFPGNIDIQIVDLDTDKEIWVRNVVPKPHQMYHYYSVPHGPEYKLEV